MKITFKALVYVVVFTCFFSAAKAQIIVPDSLRIGLGASIASTTGNSFGVGVNKAIGDEAKSAYNFGAGLALNVDVPVFPSMYITASAGYMSFFKSANASKSQQAITNVPTPNFNTIPLKLGYKFIIGNRFYIQAEAGETLLANKTQLYAMYGNAFTWSPHIGLLFPLKQRHRYIDADLRYESAETFYNDNLKNNFWALRVTYSFNL